MSTSTPIIPPLHRLRRTRTEHIDRILSLAYEGENLEDINKLIAALSPLEAESLWDNLSDLKATKSISERQSERVDFTRPYPMMEEFIESDYYLGQTLRPSLENVGIYPAWKEILVRDFNYESRIHNAVITGSLGIGKCWCSGTYMLMFDGSVRPVEDIKAGDLLLGDDSGSRKVLMTTVGEAEAYEIYPVRGEPFTVNGDHILVLKSTTSDEVVEVSVNDFLKWPRQRRHKACLYRVAADWPKQALPIDPYVFGLWLGDGHSSQTALTTMDPEIEAVWCACGSNFGLTPRFNTAGKGAKAKTIQLTYRDEQGVVRKGRNGLRNRFQALGLMTNDQKTKKFIPKIYLATSRRDRLELLAGIVDTDGYKIKGQEGTYEITLCLRELADQVRFLAQSLGYAAFTRIKVINATGYFKTTVCGAYDLPVRLARKKSSACGASRGLSNLTGTPYANDVLRSRFAVIPVGRKRYYGFTLSGNGRCLLKDFTVTHNTWIMVAILLYRITLTTLLRSPSHYFSLSRGSNIVFNILSVTREQVRQTAFGDAVNFMAASPYFLKELKFDPEMEYSKSVVPFNNNIFLTAGSKGWHVLGRNVLGVGLDEGNFRLEKDPDEKAYVLYDQVRTRLVNRFQKVEGFLPAISLLASSASDESSFTETVIRDIQKANSPATQNVYRLPVYHVKRHELKLGKRWFKVAYGLRNMEPCLLSGWYLEDGTAIKEEGAMQHEEPPQAARTELVPEMYWPEFRRNCRANLQSISGISTGGTHRLFGTLIDIERCFRGDTRVITFEGIRPIKDLAGSKHLLLTQNAPGTSGFPHPRWVEAEVKGFGRQTLWKILFRRNQTVKELFATAGHRWFVYRKKWDKRLCGKTTADLRPGDQIPSVYGQRILFRSESPTGTVLSPYGVAHGITFGDGHLASIEGIWPQQPARTVLFGDKDAELADWFLLKTRMKNVTVKSKLGIADGIWVDDLPRFFKKLPGLDESPGYLLGWLAGYFAADGCVDEHGLPSLASANRENLEFAELLALRFGIRTNGITKTMRQGCASLELPLYVLLFHVGSLPNDFFLLGKHRERNRTAQRGSTAWTVECVEQTEGIEDVFCAVVLETGCFVLDGNIFTGNCIELSQKEGVPNPLKEKVRYIPVSVEDNLNIWDYMTHSKFLTRVASRVQPIRHPQAFRYGHMDLATTSKAGLAICHLVGGQRVEGVVHDGLPFDEYRLVVEYDFILTIIAGQVKPINFDKICRFFFWLRDMCGFRFNLITADWFQCLAAGTRIWTRRGSLPIEEIKIGDKVQSGAGVERSVTGTTLYKDVPTLTLTTSDKDELTGTSNHKLGVWRRSLRPKSKSSAARYAWVRLDEVRVGDVLQRTVLLMDAPYVGLVPPSTIEHEHGCRLKAWTAPIALNEDLAVWLGVVYGDGCVSVRNGFRVAVSAVDVLDAQRVFANVFGFSPNYSPRTKEGGSIGFMCQAVYRWLLENGLMKSGVKERKGNRASLVVPELIFRSPRSVKAAFLRGAFSADGNVGDSISLSTKHKEFAVGVLLLLREFGVDACLVPSDREGFGIKSVQWHVKLRGARTLFQPIGFCYGSKQKAFESRLGVPGRNLFITVTGVKSGTAIVYDIAVEKDQSYVANGFVSHNSEMPLQNLEAAGFKVDKQSLDKDKAAYTAWRIGFEDLRMRLYRSEEMIDEAEKLMESDKKFDHPDKGSKDTTDACAGAYYNAINSEERTTLLTQAVPSVYPQFDRQQLAQQGVVMELPLPLKTSRLVKEHTLR